MNGFMKTYYKLGENALDLFILNLYWILFTILGGGILGFIPATVSVYTCIREKTIYGDYRTSRWVLFKKTYRKEFLKSNKLLALFALWVFIYVDARLLSLMHIGFISTILSVFLVVLSVILILIFNNFFPIYVHFEGTVKDYIKRSLVLIIGKPKETIMSASLMILIISMYYTFPGLIPVFGGTLYVYFSIRFIFIRILDYNKKSDFLNGLWGSEN